MIYSYVITQYLYTVIIIATANESDLNAGYLNKSDRILELSRRVLSLYRKIVEKLTSALSDTSSPCERSTETDRPVTRSVTDRVAAFL